MTFITLMNWFTQLIKQPTTDPPKVDVVASPTPTQPPPKKLVSSALLQRVFGIKATVANEWVDKINEACAFAEINTPQRIAAFLAQIGHESGNLKYTREIWGPTKQQLRYERGTSLAKTLGNTEPGDGKRYMGRGLLQTTGRANYRMTRDRLRRYLGDSVPDFEAQPQLLQEKRWAAIAAALYWRERKLNRFADSGDFSELTRRINGGFNGLAHRQALYTAALSILM